MTDPDGEWADWIECWNCGGEGVIDSECTCWEDCCACAEPEPPKCDVCEGKGVWDDND